MSNRTAPKTVNPVTNQKETAMSVKSIHSAEIDRTNINPFGGNPFGTKPESIPNQDPQGSLLAAINAARSAAVTGSTEEQNKAAQQPLANSTKQKETAMSKPATQIIALSGTLEVQLKSLTHLVRHLPEGVDAIVVSKGLLRRINARRHVTLEPLLTAAYRRGYKLLSKTQGTPAVLIVEGKEILIHSPATLEAQAVTASVTPVEKVLTVKPVLDEVKPASPISLSELIQIFGKLKDTIDIVPMKKHLWSMYQDVTRGVKDEYTFGGTTHKVIAGQKDLDFFKIFFEGLDGLVSGASLSERFTVRWDDFCTQQGVEVVQQPQQSIPVQTRETWGSYTPTGEVAPAGVTAKTAPMMSAQILTEDLSF